MTETKVFSDEWYMQRCLQLAANGLGHVSTNPMVGCVVVHNGIIIGEGYHQKYGQAHAEVNAINSVKDKSLLPQSTLYVTLEPCAHYGKTPPCADLIVHHKIPHVVIGTIDTFSQVAGKGVEKLENAGIQVKVGVLQAECREQNRRFFCYNENKRPFVVLKWAQTADGFMGRGAADNGLDKKISHTLTDVLVHRWRTEEDAILVGKNTTLLDNPTLTARHWQGRNPVRVLLDDRLEVPTDYNIFNQQAKTIIINGLKTEQRDNIYYQQAPNTVEGILQALYQHNIQSVLVEGGAATLQRFIDANLWDEARIITSAQTWGKGIKSPVVVGEEVAHLSIATDSVLTLYNK